MSKTKLLTDIIHTNSYKCYNNTIQHNLSGFVVTQFIDIHFSREYLDNTFEGSPPFPSQKT